MLFLITGFLSLVFLLFTTRYYLFGGLSVLSFLLYFIYFGNGNWLTLVLFLFGIFLLFVEVFVPGFGLIGIAGFGLIALGFFLNSENLLGSILDISLAVVISGIATAVMMKKGYKLLPGREKLVLSSSLDRERGYSASKDYGEYLGKSGIARTTLRPSGKAEVEGTTLDVVSSGAIIYEGTPIRVVHVEGIKIIVEELDEV